MRGLMHRLRTAWRVLIGRIDPDAIEKANFVLQKPFVEFQTVSLSPVHLRAEWWAHGPDTNHAISLVKRELMERAGELILYKQETDACGGYWVSGDLYIYRPSQEGSA